jgi:hypothetical protein
LARPDPGRARRLPRRRDIRRMRDLGFVETSACLIRVVG